MSKFFVRKIKIYRNYVWIVNKMDVFSLVCSLVSFSVRKDKKNGRKNATDRFYVIGGWLAPCGCWQYSGYNRLCGRQNRTLLPNLFVKIHFMFTLSCQNLHICKKNSNFAR